MTFRDQFPDFPETDIPAIPASFSDTSWGLDGCPSFTHETFGYLVFVDYSERSKRELDSDSRFTVLPTASEGDMLETDDWQEVLAFLLSRQFAKTIKEWLSPAELTEVIRRNANEGDNSPVCHTHDFCDANMAMDTAFHALFHRDIELGDSPAAQSDVDLWNTAWTKAKLELLSGIIAD